jgi:hypothetical protein
MKPDLLHNVMLAQFITVPLGYNSRHKQWTLMTINVGAIVCIAPDADDLSRDAPFLQHRTWMTMSDGSRHLLQIPWEYLSASLEQYSDGLCKQAEDNIADFYEEYELSTSTNKAYKPSNSSVYDNLDYAQELDEGDEDEGDSLEGSGEVTEDNDIDVDAVLDRYDEAGAWQ